MRFLQSLFLVALVACAGARSQSVPPVPEQQPAATPSPSKSATVTQPTSNEEINNGYVKQISETLAGREKEPAERVFKNIQWLKGVPAGRLLLIMDRGYSRALGVNCTHCHVEQDFASDDKRPKRAAREMAVMHRMINEQLKSMPNLLGEPEERAINCSTCHRGATNPMATEH